MMHFLRPPGNGCISAAVLSFLLLSSAAAQTIDPVGGADSFDLATWNVEWFGSTNANQGPIDVNLQRENVEAVIRQAGIDLWALQEISDTRQFERLVDSLGLPWQGLLATTQVTQRIAFIYNSDVVQLRRWKHILESFSTGQKPPDGQNYFAGRPPLEMEIDVLLPDTTVRMNVITLHMKCCSDALSFQRRQLASEKLKIHVDFTALSTEPVLVAGDFNDELLRSISFGNPSPYENFSNDPNNFQFTTLPLDQQNISTYCGSSPTCTTGSTIDHILMTDELFAHYVPGSSARLEAALNAVPNFVNTTSDHLPVLARFVFPTNTAVEDEPPAGLKVFSIGDLYPNPSNARVSAILETTRPGLVRVAVFDLLGRRVMAFERRVTAPGRVQVSLDRSGLPGGVYFVRASMGAESDLARFVRLPR